MNALLKSVNVADASGVYDAVADDGTILAAGIKVTGTLTDATTVGTMKTFVTSHLNTNKASLKTQWLAAQNLAELKAMELAWDEAVV